MHPLFFLRVRKLPIAFPNHLTLQGILKSNHLGETVVVNKQLHHIPLGVVPDGIAPEINNFEGTILAKSVCERHSPCVSYMAISKVQLLKGSIRFESSGDCSKADIANVIVSQMQFLEACVVWE